jgi:hypothetical protein
MKDPRAAEGSLFMEVLHNLPQIGLHVEGAPLFVRISG